MTTSTRLHKAAARHEELPRSRRVFPVPQRARKCSMKILFWVGIAMVVAWAILWLGIKMAIGAVHVLLVLGLIAIVWGLIQGRQT
jgi:Flp pilus assembly protein TadB